MHLKTMQVIGCEADKEKKYYKNVTQILREKLFNF